MCLFAFSGCGREPDHGIAALPEGAAEQLKACAAEAVPEMQIPCRVQAAANAGVEGKAALADEACAAIPEGQWREECHFRAGEELARHGLLEEGLQHCAEAGRYARYCTSHAGWGVPAGTPGNEADWATAAGKLPEELRAAGEEILRSRWWFNQFYGTGEADAGKVADSPHARGAWALEAVRLTGEVAEAKKAFEEGGVLRGQVLPPDKRVGRYDAYQGGALEKDIPRIRTYGGGWRRVGETPEEDLQIALLEGVFFDAGGRGEAVASWLQDPRPRVRYTAVQVFRMLPSQDAEATLTAMKDDPDPVVKAQVADALRYRTWEGKKRR